MFEISPIGTSAKLKPFKEPQPEMSSVELVTELVEVELQELRLYVMVGVKYAPFGVADGDMHPRQDLAHFLLVIHDDGLMGRYRPVLFKGSVCVGPIRRNICLTVRALPSVACFILGVSVDAFKSSMTSIFMCPTTLGVLLFLSEGTSGKLLSAMTRTEVLRWLPRPRFKGQSFCSSGVSVEKKPSSISTSP